MLPAGASFDKAAVKVSLQLGHLTLCPSSSSGTRNCRSQFGQLMTLAMTRTYESRARNDRSVSARPLHRGSSYNILRPALVDI